MCAPELCPRLSASVRDTSPALLQALVNRMCTSAQMAAFRLTKAPHPCDKCALMGKGFARPDNSVGRGNG